MSGNNSENLPTPRFLLETTRVMGNGADRECKTKGRTFVFVPKGRGFKLPKERIERRACASTAGWVGGPERGPPEGVETACGRPDGELWVRKERKTLEGCGRLLHRWQAWRPTFGRGSNGKKKNPGKSSEDGHFRFEETNQIRTLEESAFQLGPKQTNQTISGADLPQGPSLGEGESPP